MLSTCWSKITCPKSGNKVTSKVKASFIPYLISIPPVKVEIGSVSFEKLL